MRTCTRILGLAFLLMAAPLPAPFVPPPEDKRPITIAVAASAVPFVRAATAAGFARGAPPVVISSGATGLLARQLREGAPFDIFVAADMATVVSLARGGFVETSSVACWGRGELLLWTPDATDSTSPMASRWADWPAFVADARSPAGGRPPRFAIANPETAPFGAAARKALRDAGLWDALEPRVIRMDDVGQALQAARSGQVEAAFVPRSLLASAVPSAGEASIPVPGAGILHALGVVARSGSIEAGPDNRGCSRDVVARMLQFARTDAARKLGYLPPPGP